MLRDPHFGVPLVALLIVAGFAIPSSHAVPMLFTGMVNSGGEGATFSAPFTPDALFVVAGSQAEIFAADSEVNLSGPQLAAAHDVDFSMMDTATHTMSAISDDTPTQNPTNYLAFWNYNASLSGTLIGTVPGAQLDWLGESTGTSPTPVAGPAFLALGAVVALAAFRIHEGRI